MDTREQQLLALYLKWQEKSASTEELKQLLDLLETLPAEKVLNDNLKNSWEELRALNPAPLEDANSRIDAVFSNSPAEQISDIPRIPVYRRWWVAASVIVVMAAGAYLFFKEDKIRDQPVQMAEEKPDALPGKQGAILKLSDGREIVLDSLGGGTLAHDAGSEIKLSEGLVSYNGLSAAREQTVYNTMVTPKGRQFSVLLPDGTKVWLNAATTLKFPVQFNDNVRKVELSGEAYFEVASNATKPFYVSLPDNVDIQVLGTAFNITAYNNDQNIQTTLINGSVKVRVAETGTAQESVKVYAEKILKPGQQAKIAFSQVRKLQDINTAPDLIRLNSKVNTDQVLAWKNGVFNFDGASFEEVMRQLERWYDIEVVYKNKPVNLVYHGGMDRNVKFSEILEVFREMGVNYNWDGKTITIQ